MALIHYLTYVLLLGSLVNGGDIDADIQGNLYVVDYAANALVKYSSAGDTISFVRGFGSGAREFDRPSAVVARSGNDVWVADMYNHRVQRFNRTLDLVWTLHTRDDADATRRFGLPRDIALTRQGDLLVLDGENVRLLRFDPFGGIVAGFGGPTSGDGRLADPSEIEVDRSDNIYVLDRGSILRYDPFGTFTGRLPLPIDGAITTFTIEDDTLVVCDSTVALTYRLEPLENLDAIELPSVTQSIRLVRGEYLLVDQRRSGRCAVRSHE